MKPMGKKAGGVLLGISVPSGSPSASGPSPRAKEDPAEEMGMAAADEFMAAIKAGDSASAWEAFKSMKEACELGYEEEEE